MLHMADVINETVLQLYIFLCQSGLHFLKALETFEARKTIAKSRTLRLQSCFIHIILNMNRRFLHTRSFKRTSPLLCTDEPKIALRARNVSGVFEKRGPPYKLPR